MESIIYAFTVFVSLLLLLYLDAQSHNKGLKAGLLTIVIVFLSYIGNFGGNLGLGFSVVISLLAVIKIVGYGVFGSILFTVMSQLFAWAILTNISRLF